MELFHEIEDAHAITVSKGVWKQVKLFSKGRRVFAKHGAGYVSIIKVAKAIKTSVPNISIEEFSTGDRKYEWNKHNRLELV